MRTKSLFISIFFLLLGVFAARAQENRLSVPQVTVAPGETIALPINLDNTADIVALQFTLTLPDGFSLSGQGSLSERLGKHQMKMSPVGKKQYMVMIFSPTNAFVVGRTGKVMSLPLSADGSLTVGEAFPLTLSEVVISGKDGSNLLTGVESGQVTVRQNPDLEVCGVVPALQEVAPGEVLTANWTVKNVGGQPTLAGWTEQVELVDANGGRCVLGSQRYEEGVEPGATVARTATFSLPALVGLDGAAQIRVRLVSDGDADEPSWLQDNNTAVSEATVQVKKQLVVTPDVCRVEEQSAQSLQFKLERSGNRQQAEHFGLKMEADNRLQLPEEVVIPVGQSGVYFYANVVPNGVLDDRAAVAVEFSGNGYAPVTTTINLEDDTFPTLTLTTDNDAVTEGGNLTLHIGVNRAPGEELPISLNCDYASRFEIPSAIVMPAGSTQVDVVVKAKEDDVPDIEQVVTFNVVAPRHNAATLNTVLQDNDVPTLQMEIQPNAVSEAAGPLSVSAKLRRVDNIDKRVVVKLSDDSDNGIYYARKTVEFDPGVEEIQLNLGPVDNALVDGERTYQITAAVHIASCSCNAEVGTSGGVVTVPLTVYDNDGPTLRMSTSASVLKENSQMTATVCRNTDNAAALKVLLSSDHDAALEYPHEVEIPAGQDQVEFTITSKGNEISGDDFTAIMTATADGFTQGNLYFLVSDQTLPDAQITALSVSSEEVTVAETVTVKFTLANTGSFALAAQTQISLYLNSVRVDHIYLQEALGAGESVELSRELTLPAKVGLNRIYAVVNENNKVKELVNTNNSSALVEVKTVSPFQITLHTDKAVYQQQDPIVISGQVAGKNVSNKKVEVYAINDNYRHKLNVETDAEGKFSITYHPYDGQMGDFIVGACYPGEHLTTEMARFCVYGLKRTSQQALVCETYLNEPLQGKFSLQNPGSQSLSGVKVSVAAHPDNCEVTVNCPQLVAGGETFEVGYEIQPNAVSSGNDWEKILVKVETAEGAQYDAVIYYYCHIHTGHLKASQASIQTTMLKGTSRDYPLTITNIGKGETGKITLALPEWITTATPREMSSLASGESVNVVLRFNPLESMQLNVPVTGTIGVNCASGKGFSLPFSIEPVSEENGKLTLDVCDELTYNTAEKPHLKGAEVTISHPTRGTVVARGTTDENGRFSAELPEGYYAVKVTAAKHSSYANNLLVDPGKDRKVVVNLSYNAITVDWKVEETEVRDEYEVVTTVKYETNVPVPVVELVIPQRIEAKRLVEGESLIYNAVMTNKGMITAQDVQLLLPTDLNHFKFEALSMNEPFDLAPQQSVLIPVRVTRVATSEKVSIKGHIDDDPCADQNGTLYFWDCGPDRKWHRYSIAIQLGSCDSNDPSTWEPKEPSYQGPIGGSGPGGGPGGWGGGYGGGYGGSNGGGWHNPHVGEYVDKGCEPCQNGVLIAGLKCASHFVGDAAETLQDLMDLFDGGEPVPEEEEENGNIAEALPEGELKGVYDLLECIASAFDACVNAQANFDDIYKCYSASSDAVDQAFDDAVTAAFGRFVPADKLKKYKSFGKKMLKYKKYVDIAMDCANDFVHACDHLKDSVKMQAIHVKGYENTNDYIAAVQKELAVVEGRLKAFGAVSDVMWGAEEEWDDVSYAEMEILMDSIDYTSQTFDEIAIYKPEALSVEQFKAFFERRKQYLSGNVPVEVENALNENVRILHESRQHFMNLGYFTPADYAKEHVKKMMDLVNEGQSSVCASITLQFKQSMVMTRQAFRGTLTVFNGNESVDMKGAKLDLVVTDDNGYQTTSHEFQINMESLKGFTGELDFTSGWTLGANTEGVATVMFIPTKYAAPMSPKKYSFGGSLSYTDPFSGLTVTRALSPVVLTVNPSPQLDLTYFMQRDVMGDDPLTDTVESSEEAEFALLIHNVGYGDAKQVQMTTNQPEIVDNQKGLDVNFELMSSQLNGQEKTLALGGAVATDFGTIPAQSTSYAQWWIKSSKLGHFTSYDVEATHVSSYGNPDLSLLNEVTIHELIRSVEYDGQDNKKQVAFMVNDIADVNDSPDRMYLSDGQIESVGSVAGMNLKQISETAYLLTVTPAASGWNYGNLSDPTYGMAKLLSVVRVSDGNTVSLRNVWQTDRTLRDGKEPLYENRIHFVDDFATTAEVQYQLNFDATPGLRLAVAAIGGVPAEGTVVAAPVQQLKVTFNKQIKPETFTAEDLQLNVQGVPQKSDLIGISTEDNKVFSLDLSEVNKVAGNGYYSLVVQTETIIDAEGFAGGAGTAANWVMFRDGSIHVTTSVHPTAAGAVTCRLTEDPAGSQLGANESVSYGTTLYLSAQPDEGYEFSKWMVNGESVGSTPEIQHLVLGDVVAKAYFTKKAFEVNVDDYMEGGRIEGHASGVYNYGEHLQFVAQPDKDYVLGGWTVNGQPAGVAAQLTVEVDSVTAVSAWFVRELYEQKVIFQQGWNWISSYLKDPVPVKQFVSDARRVVGQFNELVNDPEWGMVGDLNEILPGVGYKVEALYSARTVQKAKLYDLTSMPMQVKTGWNWIGYPYYAARQLNDVLTHPSEHDYIVSQEGFAEYEAGKWEGTLTTLTPGHGYLYKSATDKTLNFNFADAVAPVQPKVCTLNWSGGEVNGLNIHKYPNTMNIIADVQVDGNDGDEGNYRIYALNGNELVGIGEYVGNHYYITVYGEASAPISFVMENVDDGSVFMANETLNFESEVIGSRCQPYQLTIGTTTGLDSLSAGEQLLKVYRMDGTLVSGAATLKSIRRLPQGVYIINGKKFVVK